MTREEQKKMKELNCERYYDFFVFISENNSGVNIVHIKWGGYFEKK